MTRTEQAHSRRRRLLVGYPRAIPVGLFIAILAITALSIFTIEKLERQRERAEAIEVANSIRSAITKEVIANVAYLRASAAVVAAEPSLAKDDFVSFVRQLQQFDEGTSAEGLGWAPLLNANEIDAWRRQVAQSEAGTVDLTPERGSRTVFAPVTHIEPDTVRNRRALGFDLYSEAVRRTAMNDGVRYAQPVLSGRVVLTQEAGGDAPGFLIFNPVFQGSGARRDVRGFVYSAFDAETFLREALSASDLGGAAVHLYQERVSPSFLIAGLNVKEEGNFVTLPFELANQDLVLEVEARYSEGLSNLSLVTLLFGLLVASLLMVVARLLTQQALEDNAAVEFLEEQVSIRNSLTRELNHRAKNTLANVLSIIALTRRRSDTLDDFADALDGRIRALSATHDLLTQSEWGTTPIRDVIQAELAPYRTGLDRAIEADGPDIDLAPNDALSLGLALHELAANAAKFGALSAPGGSVAIGWRWLAPETAELVWQEAGGPVVDDDTIRRRGFGSDLIEKVVAHEFGEPVVLDFASDGVRCVLRIPVREPSDFNLRAARS